MNGNLKECCHSAEATGKHLVWLRGSRVSVVKHNHSLSPTLFDRVPVVWDHDDSMLRMTIIQNYKE